jgi:phage shock protein PspC (stress-responsive transcriptional regulator)
MNKTININIAGSVFQIDDNAFEKLREYLQAVNVRFRQIPGGHEALDDFEARVAEIFLSKRGVTGIITLDDVEEMIAIMGRPEDIDDGYEDEVRTEPGTTGQRRLYRNPDETVIAGVAGGIGSYINVDPVWIRLLFIFFTLFYGFGFFVYIALWIALPVANSESRMRELYGSNRPKREYNARTRRSGDATADRVGGAMNEIFMAMGSFFSIIFRVIMIIFGTIFIITGFAMLVAVIITLFFNHGAWLPGSLVSETFFLSDFFTLIVAPNMVPWVIGLTLAASALPLLALMYWGMKMIFRFRAKDGIISIIALMVWVLSCVSLTMILFNEGISFAENGKSIERHEIVMEGDSLRLTAGREASSIDYERVINLPFDEDLTFYTTESGRIYCNIQLSINSTEDATPYMEVKKYGHGPSRRQALEKAGSLEYNYSVDGNSLILDTFFGLPDNSRWNGTMIFVSVYLPEGTSIYIDERMEEIISHSYYTRGQSRYEMGARWHTMTRDDDDRLRLK